MVTWISTAIPEELVTRPDPTIQTSAADPQFALDLEISEEPINLRKLEVELIEQAKEVEKQIHRDIEELKHLKEIEIIKTVQADSGSAVLTR